MHRGDDRGERGRRAREIVSKELDFLADTARPMEQVAGTRMMGGGFGGCTINIVDSGGVESFSNAIQEAYQKKFGKLPEIYITQIEDGVMVM